ncbi:MAG: hypothetical protein JSW38_09985, partial [Dehalococcoidia bacterium]
STSSLVSEKFSGYSKENPYFENVFDAPLLLPQPVTKQVIIRIDTINEATKVFILFMPPLFLLLAPEMPILLYYDIL